MLKPDYRDLAAGGAVIAIGLGFMLVSATYGLGQINRMGPGFFPFAAGAFLVLLGFIVIVPALFREGQLPRPDWRPLLLNAGSILLFAATVRLFGLLPAVMVTALASALADEKTRLIGAMALAVGLTAAIGLVFLAILRLPIAAVRMPF